MSHCRPYRFATQGVSLQVIQTDLPPRVCHTAGHTDLPPRVSHCRPNKQIWYPGCALLQSAQTDLLPSMCSDSPAPALMSCFRSCADSWANGGGGGGTILTGNLAFVLTYTYFFDSLFDLPRVYSVVKETLVYSQLYSSHILILSNTNSSC